MAMIRAAVEKNKVDYETARENFKKADTEEYENDYPAAVCSWAARKLKVMSSFVKSIFGKEKKER